MCLPSSVGAPLHRTKYLLLLRHHVSFSCRNVILTNSNLQDPSCKRGQGISARHCLHTSFLETSFLQSNQLLVSMYSVVFFEVLAYKKCHPKTTTLCCGKESHYFSFLKEISNGNLPLREASRFYSFP